MEDNKGNEPTVEIRTAMYYKNPMKNALIILLYVSKIQTFISYAARNSCHS